MEGRTIRVFPGDISPEVAEHIRNTILDAYIRNTPLTERVLTVDTETTGLNPLTDKLKLIQFRAGIDMDVYIIQVDDMMPVNFYSLMSNPSIPKVFHHAVFDISFLLMKNMGAIFRNVACTKILGKLMRLKMTSLKFLLKKYEKMDIWKHPEGTNYKTMWDNLDEQKLNYCANDVWYLGSLLQSMWLRMPAQNFADAVMEGAISQAWLKLEGFDQRVYEY